MKRAEKVELLVILSFAAGVSLLSDRLPSQIETGYLVLSLGLVFLFQTLLRDLWLMWKQREISRASMPGAACMCLESSVGFIPVIVAGVLLFSGLSQPVAFSGLAWGLGVTIIMLFGFLLKDYVIELNPLRIRKDPDHINMRFVWRRK